MVIEPGYVVVQQRAKPLSTGEWRDLPFGEAVQIIPAVSLDRVGTYPFVDIASVNAGSRSAYSAEQREFKGGGSRFKNGDTLMARMHYVLGEWPDRPLSRARSQLHLPWINVVYSHS